MSECVSESAGRGAMGRVSEQSVNVYVNGRARVRARALPLCEMGGDARCAANDRARWRLEVAPECRASVSGCECLTNTNEPAGGHANTQSNESATC